ncbi:hypothetical protein [Bacillus massiliigorillae]|uniref:hypothetical protein n=1 Tax=Bacillus massiliigorillae TaxID=1243664 RepID=UPI0003A101BB|nr:hypothetical protein [Bacillus massiliigorillae]
MYNAIIQKLDILNLILALIGMIALILNNHAYVTAIILILATLTLVSTKYKFNRALIFTTYTCSFIIFGLLFSKAAKEVFFHSFLMPSNIAIIILVAVIIGGIAAFAKFGSNTLSIVWFCLHILILISSIQVDLHSFLGSIWSNEAQVFTIREFYPFLIASMLIGVFLEKYQVEIKRDRRNNS